MATFPRLTEVVGADNVDDDDDDDSNNNGDGDISGLRNKRGSREFMALNPGCRCCASCTWFTGWGPEMVRGDCSCSGAIGRRRSVESRNRVEEGRENSC
jgi:hypothetical protein